MPKTFHKWKIGTINIRTGRDDEKLERVIKEIDKAGLTICGLQEVRRLNKGSASVTVENNNKYEVYWSGNTLKKQHGVGIVVKVNPLIEINEIVQINARIIVLDVKVNGCLMRIINCYAPTEESTAHSKQAFYSTLNKQFYAVNNKRKIICLGDFNATSSAFWYNSSLRESSIVPNLVVNNNGERFHEFFKIQNLSVMNTWFNHKKCRRVTWHSPDGITKKIYDFILCNSWIRQFITNCRVYNSYDFDSDHRIVIASLNTPSTKIARYIKRKKKNVCKRIDFTKITDELNDNFQESVSESLNTHANAMDVNLTNNELNDKFVAIVRENADSIFPKKENIRNRHPWHDDAKLQELFVRKDELLFKNADRRCINAVRKKIRNRAKFLKNEYYKQQAEKLNQLAINRELEKLFRLAREQQSTLKAVDSICPSNELLKHFKSHFNPVDPSNNGSPAELSNENLPRFIVDLQTISEVTPISVQVPTIEEIENQIQKLKLNKASNDIEPELLRRCDHPVMMQVIHRMISNL